MLIVSLFISFSISTKSEEHKHKDLISLYECKFVIVGKQLHVDVTYYVTEKKGKLEL